MRGANLNRILVAAGFPLGALGHFWYVAVNGLLYHGRAPTWAPWFWYTLCVIDFVVPVVLWRFPKAGICLAVAVMATTISVNLLYFPKFEDGPNPVLLTLLGFGAFVFAVAPALWRDGSR
jgi:hypothetical protein